MNVNIKYFLVLGFTWHLVLLSEIRFVFKFKKFQMILSRISSLL